MLKDLSKENFEEVVEELKNKYHLETYPDRISMGDSYIETSTILTAAEYFNKAEVAQKQRNFDEAIFYYDQVIKHHKNNNDDYKATFMKGFLYSAELDDKQKAKECFNNVINNFPEGELHESSQFMLDEINSKK